MGYLVSFLILVGIGLVVRKCLLDRKESQQGTGSGGTSPTKGNPPRSEP